MQKYAAELEFEQAAKVRDELHKLMGKEVEDKRSRPGMPGSKRKSIREKTEVVYERLY